MNLSLNEVQKVLPSNAEHHFGIQVKSAAHLKAMQQRLMDSGLSLEIENEVACCYAVQDKLWATDPDGNRWEVFHVLQADTELRSEPSECCSDECCSDPGALKRELSSHPGIESMTERQKVNSERLWAQFAADLRRFLRRRLPDDAAADDLLQETFLRIHRKQDELKNDRSSKAWVYQIARNLVIDYYRREEKRPVEEIEPLADDFGGPAVPAVEIQRQIIEWLRTAIDELPEIYREATRLSALDGISQQAIGERLQLSREATKSRIRRGREQLKLALNACCSFEKICVGIC